MKRQPDWRSRLVSYLGRVNRMPFSPGQMDCAIFVAGALHSMTGVDVSKDFKGRYTTIKGGFKQLKKSGFEDLVALAEAHLEEVPVAKANAGDVALVPSEDGLAFGLVQGEYIYVRHPDGLALVPLLSAAKVFQV